LRAQVGAARPLRFGKNLLVLKSAVLLGKVMNYVKPASLAACITAALFAFFALFSFKANAHGFNIGKLQIEHPYATPSLHPTTGGVFFKFIKNKGNVPDELTGARTTVAQSVELHQMSMEGDVMKMRAVPLIRLPAGSVTSFKQGQSNGYHLMLMGLKSPLKDGDRFPVWLQFKQAGEIEVMVWVQTPKSGTDRNEHKH
jgi:copper(I)-binding protein